MKFLLVPVIMACALGGTVGLLWIIRHFLNSSVRRGAALLEEIMRQDILSMEKEDLFNLYLMLEAACIKQKKPRESRIWHERAAALYPTNNFISLLVKVK